MVTGMASSSLLQNNLENRVRHVLREFDKDSQIRKGLFDQHTFQTWPSHEFVDRPSRYAMRQICEFCDSANLRQAYVTCVFLFYIKQSTQSNIVI